MTTSLKEGDEILDGRFKIIKKLGSGAFGEIFKVEKKKTGDMYAAKFVSDSHMLVNEYLVIYC